MTQPEIKARCGEIKISIDRLQAEYREVHNELIGLQRQCDHVTGHEMADRMPANWDWKCPNCGKIL